jgi:hypothetical protein
MTSPHRRGGGRSGTTRGMGGLLLACLLGFGAMGAGAQVVPVDPPGRTPVQDPADAADVTPGGAFARSLLLPGWGHVASGAPTRGAFYVAAQSATGWMLWKSMARRRSVQRFRRTELRSVEDEIRRSGVSDPDSIRFLAEGSERIEEWDELVERRGEQVEDWAALAIFLVLLGATDAFVSAHLADFPEPLSLEVVPRGAGGGWEVGLRLPFALRRPR